MNIALSDEQLLLKETFARLFAKESSIERVRAAAPLGFDPALWSALVESGVPLARVPENAGGLDLSLLDAAIIAEEAGRSLASAPLIEVVVAARLLAAAGEIAAPWLSKIANGAVVVPALLPAESGFARNLPGGAVAEAVLALDGGELVLVTGATSHAEPNIGQMPIASWNLRDGERLALLSGAPAQSVMEAAIAEWKLLSGAWLAGLSRRALELASDYANERVQFGRPIGTFQGLAHPLADAVTAVDGGHLFVWKAIASIAEGADDAAAMISLSWWWIGQATVTAVRRAVRALGGYGLSLEYDLQLYNRRGNALVLLGGDPQGELQHAGDLLFANKASALPDAGEIDISFSADETARAHMARMQAFFLENWDDRMRGKAHHSTASHDASFHRKLAQAGLIFGAWPAEHGGTGLTAGEDFAATMVLEEWNYTSHVVTITNMAGQIVMRFGSQEAKDELLPRIKAGDAVCSLGFSEPGAGSDVFAAKTTASRDGDDWIVNGQKMFTTGGHFADYVLLLTRTSSDGAKHEGLTLFAVPTSLPGYAFQPVHTYMDETTNITFYSGIRVPDRYRLGPAGEGARVMAAALTLEHSGGNYFSGQARMMRNALEWAGAPDFAGTRPIDRPSIRERLARVRARYEVAQCFVVRGISAAETGVAHRAWGPQAKMYITDSFLQNAWNLLEMGGPAGVLTGVHPLGMVELDHRRAYGATVYGGTNEIHRSIVAEQLLGLPKSRS